MVKNKKDKKFETLISRTKIYLILIAILLIILCINDTSYIVPSIVIYALIIIYSLWTNNKRRDELTRHIQDLTVNVDSTVKSSLVNSPFPLILMETSGNIIWKSSKFVTEFANTDIAGVVRGLAKEIKLDILESKFNKEEIKNQSIEREITIGKKTYKVLGEYVKSKKKKQNEYMMTLYFLDNTEKLNLEQELKDKENCIGIITIDNYEEMVQMLPDEKKSLILAEIEKNIYDWTANIGGLLVKTDRKTYMYFFNQKELENLKENKFDILDKVKEIDTDETVSLTLSIAVSNEGETNSDKYKSAQTAMDIVLGRGGDQAVIRENEKYTFFGGRTLEVEKRTKVKARTVARALEQIISESKDVMIMGHINADIDCMGSSLGIYRLAKDLGKEAYIVNNTTGETISSFIEALKEEKEYKALEKLRKKFDDEYTIKMFTNFSNMV